MPQFNVTELDFDKIKQSMVDYFKASPTYADWNFEGSGLSVLMDVLAYNTHYNAMLAHLSLNETFLDSSQIRANVVGHAKLLGYVPRSALASTAVLDFTVSPVGTPAPSITIDRGFRFQTVVATNTYTFVNLSPVTALYNSTTGEYHFAYDDVTEKDYRIYAKQGILKRMLYRVDSTVTNQKFVIPDENVDTTTLRVRIKSNENTSDYAIYTRFTDLATVTSSSQIYFLQENAQGLYEVYFGDNNFGVKPIDNSIVEIEYVYTDGTGANGATTFKALDSLSGATIPSNISVTLDDNDDLVRSYGGAARETTESIRYNAPLTFITQNRAVTADDYRAIILREVGNIQSITVWGGENAETPTWGKVYICIKPTGSATLSASEKSAVVDLVKKKNVVSITPVMVDPEYTYLSLDVFFKYNPNLTDSPLSTLVSSVRNTITAFNDDNLDRFDGVFRSSQLLRNVDATDPSILNSTLRVYMYKDVDATVGASNYFDLKFTSPIAIGTGTRPVLTSTGFYINGVEHFFSDAPINGSSNRQVFLYKNVGDEQVKVANSGTIYTTEGRVILNNFIPDNNTTIRITVEPDSMDLAPKRNQLLSIDPLSVTVTGEVDAIAVSGSTGAITYTTPSRTR